MHSLKQRPYGVQVTEVIKFTAYISMVDVVKRRIQIQATSATSHIIYVPHHLINAVIQHLDRKVVIEVEYLELRLLSLTPYVDYSVLGQKRILAQYDKDFQ